MRKLFRPLLFAAVLLFVASCLSGGEFTPYEPEPGDRTETADVILRIQMPESFARQETRTTLDFNDENRLNNITVLVFDTNNQLVGIRPGRTITYTPGLDPAPPHSVISGTGTFEVTLHASTSPSDLFTLVVLANAADIVAARLGATHASVPDRNFNAVMASLWSSVSERMMLGANRGIPMFGQTQTPVLIAESGTLGETVRLHRAVARVDVGVGTVSGNTGEDGFTWSGNNASDVPIPFRLTCVHIMRPNNRFALVPRNNVGNYGLPGLPTTIFDNPTIPDGTMSFTALQSIANGRFSFDAVNGSVHRQIYIPEADIRRPLGGVNVPAADIRSGDANHINRMAIVVGGRFDPTLTFGNNIPITYYRIDFINNQADSRTLINVLRNHLYQVSIMGVTAPGEGTPDEAYRSLAMRMNVQIVDWEQTTQEVFFDGINWIRLHHTRNEQLSRHAILYRTANTTDELRFETTIALNQWNLDNLPGLNDFHNSLVANAPNFVANGVTHTILQTVENARFRVELISTGTQTAEGRTIYTGLFRFTSLIEFGATNNPSTLRVEAGGMVGTSRVINFPITISQRGDDPGDWICGGYEEFELGEAPE